MNEVVFTKAFLFDLLEVADSISKKALEEIQVIKEQIQLRNVGKVKNSDILYRRVKHNYRLFYTNADNTVRFLRLNRRAEDTYAPEEIARLKHHARNGIDRDLVLEELDLNELFLQRVKQLDCNSKDLAVSKSLFDRRILTRLKIPQQYWQEILNLTDENDVLELNIPEEYLNILLDSLFSPNTREALETENSYQSDLKTLQDLTEGKYEIDRFLQTFLNLDRKQKEYCRLNIDKSDRRCILIKGAAGTGKSLIAFHRVKYLIEKYPQRQILFATHSKTLVDYSKRILTLILDGDPSTKNVDICTPDAIAIKQYRSKYGIPQIAPRPWQKEILKKAIQLLSSKININIKRKLDSLGYEYILDEFIKVIEAREIKDLKTYKLVKRKGQRFSLQTSHRKAIWQIYKEWKKILQQDYKLQIQEWVNQEAFKIVQAQKIKLYDYIIVDEVQDLSPVALKILIAITRSYSGIYLTADTSQSLYQKLFSFKYIMESKSFPNLTSQEKVLRKNHRNTESISKACISILPRKVEDDFIDSKTLLFDNNRELGIKPKLLLTDRPDLIFKTIKHFFEDLEDKYHISRYEGAILSNDFDDNIKEFVLGLNNNNIISEHITSKAITRKNSIKPKAIQVMNIYAAKGLEFPFVCLINFSQEKLPKSLPNSTSEKEKQEFKFQQQRLFYVACTRASKSLLVIGSKAEPSEFVSLLDDCYWDKEEI